MSVRAYRLLGETGAITRLPGVKVDSIRHRNGKAQPLNTPALSENKAGMHGSFIGHPSPPGHFGCFDRFIRRQGHPWEPGLVLHVRVVERGLPERHRIHTGETVE